eukprot:scaffold3099_cov100-Isochrysis_galbana.AAC.12
MGRPAALRQAASEPKAPSAAPCARAARLAAELWGLHSGTSRRRRCRGQIGSHSARGRRVSRSSSSCALMGPDAAASATWNRLLPPTQRGRVSPVWRCPQYWPSGLA